MLVDTMSAPAAKYAAVDVADDVRLGEAEQVVVAAEVLRVIGEALAPEVLLGQLVALEERAHRAVEHEDPLAQEPVEALEALGAGERRAGEARGSSGARV